MRTLFSTKLAFLDLSDMKVRTMCSAVDYLTCTFFDNFGLCELKRRVNEFDLQNDLVNRRPIDSYI